MEKIKRKRDIEILNSILSKSVVADLPDDIYIKTNEIIIEAMDLQEKNDKIATNIYKDLGLKMGEVPPDDKKPRLNELLVKMEETEIPFMDIRIFSKEHFLIWRTANKKSLTQMEHAFIQKWMVKSQ